MRWNKCWTYQLNRMCHVYGTEAVYELMQEHPKLTVPELWAKQLQKEIEENEPDARLHGGN